MLVRLEQQLLPHVTISPSVKELMSINEKLRKANAEKIFAIVRESFRQGTIEPTNFTRKHCNLPVSETITGYVPDDLRS